jgi:hypothetical protein
MKIHRLINKNQKKIKENKKIFNKKNRTNNYKKMN